MNDPTPYCVDFDEDLSALLDGELDEARARAVQAHLAGCGRCAARLVAFSQATAALHEHRERATDRGAALPALRARTGAATFARSERPLVLPRRARRAVALLVAAAAAIVLVVRLRSSSPLRSPAAPAAPESAPTETAASSIVPAPDPAPAVPEVAESPVVAQESVRPTPRGVAIERAPNAGASPDLLESATDDELAVAEALETVEDLELIENLELIEALAAEKRS